MPHKQFKTTDQRERGSDAFTGHFFNKGSRNKGPRSREDLQARIWAMKGMGGTFPRQRSKFEDVPGIRTVKRPLSDVAKDKDLFDR